MSNFFEVKEVKAKGILTKSNLPDCDYVVNPYTGCRFGCTYCYASFMGRFVDKSVNDWGNYVFVKTNSVELLAKDIKSLKNKGKGKTVFFSSVTDPYQGLEAKYKLTRGCLQVLADCEFEGLVGILTKSNLVLRDIDIFKQLKNVEVGLTITSTSDDISRYFEKFAPSANERLSALKQLNEQDIKTYAFVGPLLPHFVSKPKQLEDLFKRIEEVGTKDLYIEHINLKGHILERFLKEMPDLDQKTIDKFYKSQDKSYRDGLNKILLDLVKKYNFNLRLGSAIYHHEL